MRTFPRIAAALVFAIAGPLSAESQPPLADALRPFVEKHELAGAVALVADKNGTVSVDTVGFSDLSGGKPMRADSMFLKWNDQRYKTLDEVRSKAPAYRHAVLVTRGPAPPDDPAKKHEPADLRLPPGCSAIDAGEKLVGFNGDFAAGSPDLGAYEFGEPLPHYGPRPHQPAR
jgi:hypothetical protein